jgi:deoxyribodipyrimidine photo-lyase
MWFRRDLRLHDNAALTSALREARVVLPLFIFDDAVLQHPETGPARVAFLLGCLRDLDVNLQARGSALLTRRGEPATELLRVAHEVGAEAVYISQDVERAYGHDRDQAVAEALARAGIALQRHRSYWVSDLHADREAWGKSWEAWAKLPLYPTPTRMVAPPTLRGEGIPALGHLGHIDDGKRLPAPGETAAHARLQTWLGNPELDEYHRRMGYAAWAEDGGTSHLSPYIKFGCISVRACWQAAEARAQGATPEVGRSMRSFQSRLRWRDHFTQKFLRRPSLEERASLERFDTIRRPEEADERLLHAWAAGHTGYPLVDAAARALVETGWLNFRMRAMLATFLCLNLWQAWQLGALHFMRHLIDGDVPIDHWQWQMQAGATKLDGAIRCYNPHKTALERDPEGEFLGRYLPEVRHLPMPYRAAPHLMTPMEQQLFGIRPGLDYPLPIVDYRTSRDTALARINALRQELAARGVH